MKDTRTSGQAPTRLAARLLATAILLNLFVYAIVGLSLYKIRQQYAQGVAFSTYNLAQTLEANVSSIIDRIDTVLFAVAEEAGAELSEGRLQPTLMRSFLGRLKKQTPELYGIHVADARGELICGTDFAPGRIISASDREYFRALRDDPRKEMVISKPLVSHATGKWVLVIARKVSAADGTFLGIVTGTITLEHFKETFASLDLGPHGAMSLRDSDLAQIVRVPDRQGVGSAVGERNLSREVLASVRATPDHGSYTAEVKTDRIRRTISYRKLAKHPLYIFVGQATQDYLAPWYHEAGLAAALLAFFTLLSLFSVRQIRRRWRQETEAMEAVRQREEDLQEQAALLEEEIEDRIRAEKGLAESEGHLRSLFDGSPVGMFRTTLDGRFLQMNGAQAAMFGYSSPQGMMDEVNPSGAAGLWASPEARAELVAAARSAQGSYVQRQVTLYRKDGSLLDAIFYIMATTDPHSQEPCLVGFIQDLTERKKLEEQLYQSQKMESIGRLAGGVAHDFNNMLSVILGAAQLAMPKVPQGSELWELLDAITMAAERSSGITRQLLAFSRKDAILPKAIDLNAHVAQARTNLGRLIGEDVQLRFLPGADLWTIRMDPSQVDQILMNLSVNARDAMRGGGSLTLATKNIHIDSDYCHSHPGARPGDYVLLTVADTGCGMDSETQKRIFEPFFTTKPLGEGTGLGLSTVYGIVTQNEGFIQCCSEPGQGTTFYIHLPRLAEPTPESEEAGDLPSTGTGTILLVEDEEMLMRIASKLLQQLGYTVIQAQSPQAAISICEQPGQAIDLILTDVIMPEMNGKEMVDRIKGVRPDLKVIFMSGYTADIVAHRGIVEAGMNYVQKPLELHRLREEIGRVLRDAAPAPAEAVVQDVSLSENITDDVEVIDLFRARATEYLDQIEAGLRGGDCAKICFFAHKLRGAAAAVGGQSLATLAGTLEDASGSGAVDPGAMAEAVSGIKRELERLLAALDAAR
ncbi:ATP-binding protein [Geomonas anaerohicana]|uniref:histidine kinase n=1 Tax=Geomonas anaerohicana TaxID=2798583 RepID=A0ABS0YA70_9BACT|nr:ATP-binding protein [Geomonas anaerohicana]MBJ6749218.1 response regulator [Geomonas anaerohicana]